MKLRNVLFTLLGILIFSGVSLAQDISKIKINKTYSDHLDAILLDIYYQNLVPNHLFFSYDANDLHAYSLSIVLKNAPLDSVLKLFSNQFNLKYTVEDNIINIISKRVVNSEDTPLPVAQQVELSKTYTGSPKNFNFTLSGRIKDESTGESLPYAAIEILGQHITTTTNADGYFTFVKVPSDTSTLKLSYIGYQSKFFYLTPDKPKSGLIITMSSQARALKEVEIIGQKEEVMNVASSDVGTIKMSPQKLSALPSMGDRDIMRAFQLMPGVSGSHESSSNLYVRGGTPDQNLVLYDGFTVYHVDHLYGFFSAFNANAIKECELFKGAFESKYGGRLSSVTEITGKDGNQNKFNMGGEISLLSFNAYAEAPITKKLTVLVAFRKSYKGPLYNEIFKEFNNTKSGGGGNFGGYRGRNIANNNTTVTSYFYDLNTKISYRPTDKDIITLSFYNGIDKLDNSTVMGNNSAFANRGMMFNSDVEDLTKYGNTGGSLKWSRKWNDRLYGNTLVSYSDYFSNRNNSSSSTVNVNNTSGDTKTFNSGTLEHNDIQDLSVKSDYQWNMFKNSMLEFGGFASYYNVVYTYSQNDTTTILNQHNYGTLAGVYVQDKLHFFQNKFMLLPGVRMSYYGPTDKGYVEPRFQMNYQLTERLKLKAATGKYNQFANQITQEDILSGSRDFWILANKTTVPVSNALHYVLGGSYETKDILFDVEAYYKVLEDLTQYTLRFSGGRGGPGGSGTITYTENFFQGSNIAKGIEFLLQKKTGKLNGWVCYTLGQSMDHFIVYADKPYAADQDVRNEFKIVGMYKHNRWDFSSTWIYATGMPFTAPEGGYQLTMLDGTTKDYINVGAKNALRYPDYHRLDLAANYHFLNEHGKDIGYIGVSIFNVYNRQNVWYKKFQIVDGTVVVTNVNYLGFTPNITLSLKIR